MTIEEIEKQIAQAIYDTLSGRYGDFTMPHDAAKAVIDVLGLEVETRVTTYPAPGSEQFDDATVAYDEESGRFVAVMDGLDISDKYNDWFDSLPFQSRIIGRIEE